MDVFTTGATTEITAASGTVRVTITPKPAWLWLLVDAGVTIFFALILFREWTRLSVWSRILFIWGEGGGIFAFFYQLSGTETIEFDAQKLVIRKQILGWDRRSEYPIDDCSQLETQTPRRGTHSGLQCRIGWRKIRFAYYLSEDQAIEILTTLQNNLPDVAQKLGATPQSKQHVITLGL